MKSRRSPKLDPVADPDDSEASADEESAARRPGGRRTLGVAKEVVHRPTRQQKRAAAPEGLLVEDILRRIEFDDTLLAEDFTALVDPVDHSDPGRPPTPRGAKWCRAHCWTGCCRFAEQCWYSHGGQRLFLWGSSPEDKQAVPGLNRSPLPQLAEVGLHELGGFGELGHSGFGAHALCLLLWRGKVVWGRDLGAMGAELWGRFARRRRQPGVTDGPDDAPSASGAGSACLELPQAVFARVVRCLGPEELVACALGLGGLADWEAVMCERWPTQPGAASQGAAPQGAGLPPGRPERQVASLVEASRLAAQLLCWPTREVFAGAASGSTPSTPSFSPSTPVPPSPMLRCGPDASGTAAAGPVLQWAEAMVEPAFVRSDARVESLRLDAALVVLLSAGGSLRVVRRSDLKQITSLKVKDASCFDFGGEALVVGTFAPARLVAYDLSASQPKAGQALKLGADRQVTAVVIAEHSTYVCGLGREDERGPVEVAVVVEGEGVVQRFDAEAFAPCGLGGACVTMGPDGGLSVWGCGVQSLRRTAELAAPREGAPGEDSAGQAAARRAAFAAGGRAGRFVAAVRHGVIWAHDRERPDSPPRAALRADAAAAGLPAVPFRWIVELLHVEGPLLVAVAWALPTAAEFDLDIVEGDEGEGEGAGSSGGGGADVPPTPQGARLFAWHLPTCRPLLDAWPAAGRISAFGRADVGDCGLMAFGVERPLGGRDQRVAHGVVLPGAGTVTRASRRSGLSGTQRRLVSSSDARQSRMRNRH